MSEFMILDAKAPATMEAVVEAVMRLSTLSEPQILESWFRPANWVRYFPSAPTAVRKSRRILSRNTTSSKPPRCL